MASFSADIELDELYQQHYRQAKHPGDEHRGTCWTYELEIKKLNDFFQFMWWRSVYDSPPRKVSTADLYAVFEWWRDECALPSQLPRKVRLSDCSDSLVVGAMNWLIERGRERTTANKIRLHVNAVWRWGNRQLKIPERPDNDAYRVNINAPIAFLPEELERILGACARRKGLVGKVPAGIWWTMCCSFIHAGALRINAARKVPVKKIDFVRGGMWVPSGAQKNRREKWIDLFPSTINALKACRLVERGVELVLGDWPYGTNALRDHFAQILVEAGIFANVDEVPRELKFHALRKTLASQIYAKAGLQVACDRLDHSSSQVTKRYIDPRYESQTRINELVKDPLSSPPDTRPPLRIADVG